MSNWQYSDIELHAVHRFHANGSCESTVASSLPPGTAIDPYVAPAATIPSAVSRFQARAALHLAGLLVSVEALMADPATPMLSRLAWQDAQEFRRTSPTVLAMAAALSLDEAELDALFTTASGIEA